MNPSDRIMSQIIWNHAIFLAILKRGFLYLVNLNVITALTTKNYEQHTMVSSKLNEHFSISRWFLSRNNVVLDKPQIDITHNVKEGPSEKHNPSVAGSET